MKTVNMGRAISWGLIANIISIILLDLSDQDIPKILWYLLIIWGLTGSGYFIFFQNKFEYFLKRLLEAFVSLFVIASLCFILLRTIPGGPFDQERALPAEVKASIEKKYGLDRPLYEQYLKYMLGIAKGDLGESYKYVGRPVTEIIMESFPVSFQMGFYSLILALLMGIPLGVFAAYYHNRIWDHLAMFFAISGVALPSFFVGPLLVMVFCFGVPFAFLEGSLPPALWESPAYYILPVITLGIRPAAIIARLIRASVLEVKNSDFIRTAKAKGLGTLPILYKHILKNSMIPCLSVLGPLSAGILSGSFVNEILFAVPGMGKHLVQSVTNRDYPLVLGLTLIYSVLLILANFIIDILYVVFDPRIEL